MTTFQDPPPQSRRAVRQSERGETPEQISVEQIAVETQPYSFDAAQLQESAPTPPALPAVPHSGRRVQLDAGAPGSVEVRQAPVQVERVQVEDVQVEDVQVEAISPQPLRDLSLGVQPSPDPSVFRARDFSPEVRSHSAAVPVDLEDRLNHTLTRRELREIRAAQEEQAPALALPEPIDTLLNSGPIEIPTLAPAPGQSQALADAMAEFDQLTRARRDTEARARDLQVASLATARPVVPVVPVPAVHPFGFGTVPEDLIQQPSSAPASSATPVAPPLIEPSPTGPAPVLWSPPPPTGLSVPQAPPAAVQAAAVEDAVIEGVVVEAAVQPPVVGSDADPVHIEPVHIEPVAIPVVIDPVAIDPTNAANRPAGHWSIQAALEDDETPFENTLSRTVGTGTSAITTSALVLPSVPQASDLTRPFASTGEILMTGSIDLPHSLGSTGAHPHRIDNSDFEDDPLDSQMAAPDSAPVRAIRAVSTHTSTRGVIENKKPQNNRWLTRVIIGVSTLLVVGVGLLVYVLVTHTY